MNLNIKHRPVTLAAFAGSTAAIAAARTGAAACSFAVVADEARKLADSRDAIKRSTRSAAGIPLSAAGFRVA